MSKALELAREADLALAAACIVEPIRGSDAQQLARALLRESSRVDELEEVIAASHEVATAKDVLWFEQENKRMRAAFQDLVDSMTALKDGNKAFDIKVSGCEWCNAKWPKTKNDTYDITMERAKRHAYTCSSHPLKIERDALLEENARLRGEK